MLSTTYRALSYNHCHYTKCEPNQFQFTLNIVFVSFFLIQLIKMKYTTITETNCVQIQINETSYKRIKHNEEKKKEI